MRHLLRQSIKVGGYAALNQFYKSSNSDIGFIIFSIELDSNGKICEIVDKHFEYTSKHKKLLENEYDS